MAEAVATVDGHAATMVRVYVPARGAWVAEVDLAEEHELSGRVEIQVGALTLSGTVDEDALGAFGSQTRARIVGGGGGWGTEVTPLDYHNDAGVKARNIVDDIARAAGETIGTFTPAAERVGIDYVRRAGKASVVLDDVIGRDVAWWVDYAGTTQVGARSSTEATGYTVLAFDPRDRVATLAADDLGSVLPGQTLTQGLASAQVVRDIEIRVTEQEARIYAYCSPRGLAEILQAIVRREIDARLVGSYRYRVVKMNGDRVDLQVVRKASGLPDALPVSMWPGVAGAHAQLTPSAEVLVTFIEGDRRKPVITHFAGKDGVGFVPVNLTFDATTLLKLGASASQFVALADLVLARLQSTATAFDAHTHTVTGGATSPPVAIPSQIPIGVVPSVAATKVQAQ